MNEVMRTNIDENGVLRTCMPAEPEKMRCEAKGCNRTDGRDYKRKQWAGSNWNSEPIFLCPEHGYLGNGPTTQPK